RINGQFDSPERECSVEWRSTRNRFAMNTAGVESTMIDLAPPIGWAEMDRRDHFVQFYEDDGFLVQSIAGFLTAGFTAGESAVVIATPAHRRALDQRLN